jgi:hypothetical protein
VQLDCRQAFAVDYHVVLSKPLLGDYGYQTCDCRRKNPVVKRCRFVMLSQVLWVACHRAHFRLVSKPCDTTNTSAYSEPTSSDLGWRELWLGRLVLL